MAAKGPPLSSKCTSKYGKVCCREEAAGTSRQGEGGEQEITGRRAAGRTAAFKGKEPSSPCCKDKQCNVRMSL